MGINIPPRLNTGKSRQNLGNGRDGIGKWLAANLGGSRFP
jgi:hypothetical protein